MYTNKHLLDKLRLMANELGLSFIVCPDEYNKADTMFIFKDKVCEFMFTFSKDPSSAFFSVVEVADDLVQIHTRINFDKVTRVMFSSLRMQMLIYDQLQVMDDCQYDDQPLFI